MMGRWSTSFMRFFSFLFFRPQICLSASWSRSSWHHFLHPLSPREEWVDGGFNSASDQKVWFSFISCLEQSHVPLSHWVLTYSVLTTVYDVLVNVEVMVLRLGLSGKVCTHNCLSYFVYGFIQCWLQVFSFGIATVEHSQSLPLVWVNVTHITMNRIFL